eukprot:GABV01000175.1.p1 GENE.GABV01000175.1~~GABV01000175.1.p1  ORF type:complete len:493 (-),score=114.96 GABV01000175.1:23-1501(-)
MITASHNPELDNGVKIVDPDGGMLAPEWETIASDLANCSDSDVKSFLERLIVDQGVSLDHPPSVYIGADTRPSSPQLAKLCVMGARALGANVRDFGQLTTPQLHWLVRKANQTQSKPLVNEYYSEIAASFTRCMRLISLATGKDEAKQREPTKLTVDCSFGVGALAADAFRVNDNVASWLHLKLINRPGEGSVNDQSGAEFVQKQRQFPKNTSSTDQDRFAAIDGDADRLVYFFSGKQQELCLLDGDKILSILAEFIGKLLTKAGAGSDIFSSLKIGAVQTAYANGASTAFISKQLPTECAKTGVKHLHAKAHGLDIGIYFEANGHGTVLFSSNALNAFRNRQKELVDNPAASPESLACAQILCELEYLINQAVGDALSILLVTEVALSFLDRTLESWSATYTELPSRMTKVDVPDRFAIQTTNAERTCTAPEGLQSRIDDLIASVGGPARAFVRPSGTEDIVRVYAEAATQQLADQLAGQVSDSVKEFCKK